MLSLDPLKCLEQLKCLRPEFREPIYEFFRRPPSSEVDRLLKAYDCRLFLLWSRIHSRWELWRWKQEVLPRDPSSELEIYELARLQCHEVVPDMRLIQALPAADLWKAAGTNDPDKTAEHREKEADKGAKDERKAISEGVKDLVADNANILRRDIGDAFSGYYPQDDEKAEMKAKKERWAKKQVEGR